MAGFASRCFHFAQFVPRPFLRPNCIKIIVLATPLLLVSLPLVAHAPKNLYVILAKETPQEATGSSSSSSNEAKRRKKEELRRKRLIDLVDAKNSKEDHHSARRLLREFKAEETGDPRVDLMHSD